MDSATSVERQLYILSLLSQNTKGYTLNEIIDSLKRVGIDATRRMVARDMDSISRDFFVYEDERDGQVVYKADKYAAGDMDFTMPQIISLYYMKELLGGGSAGSLSKEAADIIDRILEQMPRLSKAALKEVADMIKVVPQRSVGEEIDGEILETLRRAIGGGNSVDISYKSLFAGDVTERRFDPYVLEVRDGCWHTIGHCHLRGSVRDFRLSRIISAVATDHTYTIPKGFYEQYSNTRFDKLAGDDVYDICVVFSGDSARIVEEYHAGRADRITQAKDGIRFEKRAALTPDIVQWIMQFGAEARVEQPQVLAEKICGEAARITQNYKGTGHDTKDDH